MTNRRAIVGLFEQHGELTVKELVEFTGASKQMVHIVLNQMLAEGTIQKLGKAPKTLYRRLGKSSPKELSVVTLPQEATEFLRDHFMLITEIGEIREGAEGFALWCQQRSLPFEKTVSEFITTRRKYLSYYHSNGLIDGTKKLHDTVGYEEIFLDTLYYLDFYAIERFGKTRLGVILHYAKQGQNKMLMGKMMDEVKPRVLKLISELSVGAVGFVPPTIRREVQIMKFIQERLKISLPLIHIKKVSGVIPVPQKSLSKLPERISNAENTFSVTKSNAFDHVLLIDDAVGSGSTMNQIAGKIKAKGIAKKVTGLAIVGSFKGFDVITDV